MLTRRQCKQEKFFAFLLVVQCVAHVGFRAEVEQCTVLSRALRGDAQLWEVLKDHKGPRRRTRLMYAARVGDFKRAVFLLDRKASMEEVCNTGATAMIFASEFGHVEVAHLLLDRGANVNASSTNYGWTSLMWASQNGRVEIARLLLDRGANMIAASTNGWTSLMVASKLGHLEIARLLLDRGANVNAALTDDGMTSLIWASDKGHVEIVCCKDE